MTSFGHIDEIRPEKMSLLKHTWNKLNCSLVQMTWMNRKRFLFFECVGGKTYSILRYFGASQAMRKVFYCPLKGVDEAFSTQENSHSGVISF